MDEPHTLTATVNGKEKVWIPDKHDKVGQENKDAQGNQEVMPRGSLT